MFYKPEQAKYYRFPSRTGLLDYEMDHQIYFPSKEQSFTNSDHNSNEGKSGAQEPSQYQKGVDI